VIYEKKLKLELPYSTTNHTRNTSVAAITHWIQ
jgi:hypothetical protein